MTKLDWSKGYTPDPARVRAVEDFSCPDAEVVLSVKPLRKSKPRTWEQLEDRKRRRQAAKPKKVSANRTKPKKPKDGRSKQEKALAAVEHQAKRATHNERYLALAASKERAMTSKKKSHLQAWIEKQTSFSTDRGALRQQWRARLLRRSEPE